MKDGMLRVKRSELSIEKRAEYDKIMSDFLGELNEFCPEGASVDMRLDAGADPKRVEITNKYMAKLKKLVES